MLSPLDAFKSRLDAFLEGTHEPGANCGVQHRANRRVMFQHLLTTSDYANNKCFLAFNSTIFFHPAISKSEWWSYFG